MMNLLKLSLIPCLLLSLISSTAYSAASKIDHLEPMFWWVGMNNPNLQLMVYGEHIGNSKVEISYPGVQLKGVTKVDNDNYLFLNLQISSVTKAGKFNIVFRDASGKEIQYPYELKQRRKESAERKGFDSSDVIYLIMPDRFANGNPDNDSVGSLSEKADRNNPDGRHGGDIQGIINHLDYLEDLGITALWNTPLLEDNEAQGSYHSYAISDYYKIDARFGTNKDYRRLSQACQKHGIKLIMDMVFNHCGMAHWWMKDLPSKDWVHLHDNFTPSNHRKSTIQDPYASKIDRDKFLDGWFVGCMPDLNQQNELLMTYLIQNSIWWVEYADLGGIRMDTYPYNDPQGMSKWGQALLIEYPHLNFVGETWYKSAADIAYWQKDALNADGYNSYLPCVMDFQLFFAMQKAFTEPKGWEEGMVRLYESLAADYLYHDTGNLLVFAENHDTDRIMSVLDGDLKKFKLLMTFLLTTRGTPQIYEGIEILMQGKKSDGDGEMRIDFPGGWKQDQRNAFTKQGRTAKEESAFQFLRNLLNWRKNNVVIHSGNLKHYVPENNVYVYFRSNSDKKIMVVLNNNSDTQKIDLGRFSKSIKSCTKGKDILSAKVLDLSNGSLSIAGNTSLIIELQ